MPASFYSRGGRSPFVDTVNVWGGYEPIGTVGFRPNATQCFAKDVDYNDPISRLLFRVIPLAEKELGDASFCYVTSLAR